MAKKSPKQIVTPRPPKPGEFYEKVSFKPGDPFSLGTLKAAAPIPPSLFEQLDSEIHSHSAALHTALEDFQDRVAQATDTFTQRMKG
jgi:hypothetical protein